MPFSLPKEILVALAAASPILEIKGSIPLGRLLNIPIEATFFWSITGNILITYILLKYIDPVSKWLAKHSKWFKAFLAKIFEQTRVKHSKKFEQIGTLLLIPIAALPFPGSGAWTAAIIAYLFNIPIKKALPIIITGTICGAILLCTLVYGIAQL
jgi:uncharacterized membrane protein